MYNSCSVSNSDCSQLSETYHAPRNFQIITLYLREFCSIPCLEQSKSGATEMLLISKPVIPPAAISRQLRKSLSLCHNFCSIWSDTFSVWYGDVTVIGIKSNTLKPEIPKLDTGDLFLYFIPLLLWICEGSSWPHLNNQKPSFASGDPGHLAELELITAITIFTKIAIKQYQSSLLQGL